LVETQRGSGRGRLIQYRNTGRMIRDHMLLGVGPSNWRVHYPRYASADDPSYQPFATQPTGYFVHSDWLEIAADTGILALATLIGFIGATLVASWRRLQSTQFTSHAAARAIPLLGVVSALAVTGAVDVVLLLPAQGFLAAAVVGSLSFRSRALYSRPLSRLIRLSLLTLLTACTGSAVLKSAAAILAARMSISSEQPRGLANALRLDPGEYRLHIALAEVWLNQRRCDPAMPHIRAAVRLFPFTPAPRQMLAACARRQTRDDAR